jgi:hypothetical protein
MRPTLLAKTSWSMAALCVLCSKRALFIYPIDEANQRKREHAAGTPISE